MLQDVLLPQLGQTMEEGTVEKWHKKEGDTVRKGEILFDLTTDKATLEVEAFADGIVKKILVPEGQVVPVNELIAIIGDPSDELPKDMEAYRAQVRSAAGVEAKASGPAAPVGAAPLAQATTVAGASVVPPAPQRILASPRAKKLAAERKVPLNVLRGTGPEGRVIERDIEEYAAKLDEIKVSPAAREMAFEAGVNLLAVQPAEPGQRIMKEDVQRAIGRAAAGPLAGRRIELSAMRKTIAQRMAASKQIIPHFYLFGEVLMRSAMARRTQLNASGELHVTVTDMLVKAVALALKAHPRVNARFDRDAIVLNQDINIGVAVAVEDGLFVPVIKNADAKDLAQISSELKALAATAREGKLRPDQYEGGSITISNLGVFGIDYFMPIINPPESCILGIGRVAEQVVVRDGAIQIEPVMKVSLSGDHRAIDGAQAAQFFKTFRELLEKPEQL